MKTHFKYCILIGAFFWSCEFDSAHKNQDRAIVPVHTLKIEGTSLHAKSAIILDSILKSVKYVPLETNDASIIGRINDMVVSRDHIFILDIEQTESIFIFNKFGKFVNKIYNKGKGPGEYMQPADIAIYEPKKELYLLNEFPPKIIKYNFDGSFVGETQLPFRFSSLTVLENGSLALVNEPYCRKYGNPPGRINDITSKLYFITPSGESFQGGGSIEKAFEENMTSNRYFGLMKNSEIIYHPLFNDTIFGLREYESYPLLALDFGKNSINISEVDGLEKKQFLEYCAANNSYFVNGQYSHTKDFLIFYIRSAAKNVAYLTIYNRRNREYLSFPTWNSTLFNPCNLIPRTSWEKYFVSIISPARLIQTAEALKAEDQNSYKNFLQFTPPLEILNKIDENSNPVLAFYTLRPEKINMESVYLNEE